MPHLSSISAQERNATGTSNNNDWKLRQTFTGQQLFEHTWEWSSNSPQVTSEPAKDHADLPKVRNRPITEARLRRAGRFTFGDELKVEYGDGLGPLYNAKSCTECHVSGGGSDVKHNVTLVTLDPRVRPDNNHDEFAARLRHVYPGFVTPRGLLTYSTIVHNFSTRPGYDEIRNRLASLVEGGIAPNWYIPDQRTSAAIARQPVIAGRYLDIDFYLSQRNSPPLYGLGLIDQITDQQLQQVATKQESRSGGKITGRVAGKFGWQGQATSLAAFIDSACAGELGLNQQFLAQTPDHAEDSYINPGLDITQSETSLMFSYVSAIPRPIEAKPDYEENRKIRAGEKIFNSVGCVDCHVPDIRPAKGIFSDLLLHDMGERLQGPSAAPATMHSSTFRPATLKTSNAPSSAGIPSIPGYYTSQGFSDLPEPRAINRPAKPQFPRVAMNEPRQVESDLSNDGSWDALQREWKTPPLWGVRDSGPYLHDGRATTIEEAIEWHGGESEDSRAAFTRLSLVDKDLLLSFLNSLQAPKQSQDIPAP